MAKAPRRRSSSYKRRARQGRYKVSALRSVRGRRVAKRNYASKMFRLYRNPLIKNRILTTLQYNTNISLNPTIGSLGSAGANVWVFNANSIFDPDQTGTGHQPMYADDFDGLYNRYRVNYAQITVTVVNHFVNTDTGTGAGNTQTTTPNYSYKLAIVADRDNNTEGPNNINQLIEEGGPNIKWRFIAPALTGKLPKLYHSISPHRICGLSFRDDTLQADVGANPTRTCYFWVAIASADGNTDPPSVYLNVRIKYFVEYFDRRVLQPEN